MRFQVVTLLWNLCLPMQNALVYPKNFLKTIKSTVFPEKLLIHVHVTARYCHSYNSIFKEMKYTLVTR